MLKCLWPLSKVSEQSLDIPRGGLGLTLIWHFCIKLLVSPEIFQSKLLTSMCGMLQLQDTPKVFHQEDDQGLRYVHG